MTPVWKWNGDKPHRCPNCHAVAVDMELPKSWRIYTCCTCGARFARWPWLTPALHEAGIRCRYHRTPYLCELTAEAGEDEIQSMLEEGP